MLRWKLMPQVWLVARRIAQRAERNRELGGPALVGDLRAHRPRAVPVDVEARARAARLHLAEAEAAAALPFVGHLAVVLDAGGIGAEHEAVLPIAIGVDDHLEAVGVVHRRVAPRIRDDDAGWIGVVHHRADVERVGGEHDPHFGALRHRLPFVGLLLPEGGDRRGLRPGRIAEHVAIERRRLSRLRGGRRRWRCRPAPRTARRVAHIAVAAADARMATQTK